MSGENRKKTFGILSIVVILIVTGLVIMFLGRNQDTRSRAAAGDPISFSLDPGGAITKAPGETFTALLYLNTGSNNISAVAPVITSSDPSMLKIISFAQAPAANNPYLSNVVLNTVSANGATLRYIVVNKSVNNVASSPNLLLGTITLQAVGAGTATLKIDIGTQATDATIYDTATSIGLPIQNITTNTNLATVTIASPTVAAPTCEVSFTFPQTITPNTDVKVTFTSLSPSDPLSTTWQYSTLYELDSSGQIMNNLGGCGGGVCTFTGKVNTVGTHRVQLAVRDAETYNDSAIKLPGQTENKIWCKTQGNDTFTTGAATSANPTQFSAPAGWSGPSVSYTLSPQNPKAGEAVTITINNKDEKGQSLPDVAMLYDGQSLPQSWATGGGGGNGTTWAYTFPSAGNHTIQLKSCSYASTSSQGGPNCSSGTAYNEATITVDQ